jgi:hypothetical protein
VLAAAREEHVTRLRACGCSLVLASPIGDGQLAAATLEVLEVVAAAPRRRS